MLSVFSVLRGLYPLIEPKFIKKSYLSHKKVSLVSVQFACEQRKGFLFIRCSIA